MALPTKFVRLEEDVHEILAEQKVLTGASVQAQVNIILRRELGLKEKRKQEK